MKKLNKKGFTLVELIVVLVILGILAAILVPALTGYIDKAKQDKLKATTRQVVVAAQTVVSERYGQKGSGFVEGVLLVTEGAYGNFIQNDTHNKIDASEICSLAEVLDSDFTVIPGEITSFSGSLKYGLVSIGVAYDKNGKLTYVTLSDGARECKYDGETGEYTITQY